MKKLLSISFFSALVTMCRMISGFIVAKVIAIYIGPSGMAMLGQVQNVMAVLNGVAASPAGNGIVRYTAQYNKDGYESCIPWWRASIKLIMIILTIIIPLGGILSTHISSWLFLDAGYYWVILLCLAALPLSAFGNFLMSVINGQQLFKRYIVQSLISVIITNMIMIFFIIKANVVGALAAVSLQNGLVGFTIILGSARQPWLGKNYLWGNVGKEHFKALISYMLMALTTALTMPVALMFIRNLIIEKVGWEAAGQWQAVWKISETYLSVLTIALSTYYLPRLSVIENNSLRKEVNKTAQIFIPIAASLALCVYLFRDYAISLLFTKDFLASRDLFSVQLVGDVIKIASWLYAFPMLSKGMTKLFISTEIIFSVSWILFSYFFIDYYGLQGANLAYVINYLFYFVVIFFFVKPTKKS